MMSDLSTGQRYLACATDAISRAAVRCRRETHSVFGPACRAGPAATARPLCPRECRRHDVWTRLMRSPILRAPVFPANDGRRARAPVTVPAAQGRSAPRRTALAVRICAQGSPPGSTRRGAGLRAVASQLLVPPGRGARARAGKPIDDDLTLEAFFSAPPPHGRNGGEPLRAGRAWEFLVPTVGGPSSLSRA